MTETVKPSGVEHELAEDAFVVSMTDREGRITYVNRTFLELTGYSEGELLGRPHSVLRDPAMPAGIFRRMWETLKHDREFVLIIRSLGRDGSFHWGFSHMIPSHDATGSVVGYYSVRRKASPQAISAFSAIYQTMREQETRAPGESGVKAGLSLLDNMLAEKGMGYEEFLYRLQAA